MFGMYTITITCIAEWAWMGRDAKPSMNVAGRTGAAYSTYTGAALLWSENEGGT